MLSTIEWLSLAHGSAAGGVSIGVIRFAVLVGGLLGLAIVLMLVACRKG